MARHMRRMFRRTDPLIKYVDSIAAMADEQAQECKPQELLVGDDEELDYFDRLDLGALRRRLRHVGLLCVHYMALLWYA